MFRKRIPGIILMASLYFLSAPLQSAAWPSLDDDEFTDALETEVHSFVKKIEQRAEGDIDAESTTAFFLDPFLEVAEVIPPGEHGDHLRGWLLDDLRSQLLIPELADNYAKALSPESVDTLQDRFPDLMERWSVGGKAAITYLVESGRGRDDMQQLMEDVRRAAIYAERLLIKGMVDRRRVYVARLVLPTATESETDALLQALAESYPASFQGGSNSGVTMERAKIERLVLGLEVVGQAVQARVGVLHDYESKIINILNAVVLEHADKKEGTLEERVSARMESYIPSSGEPIVLLEPSSGFYSMYSTVIETSTGLIHRPDQTESQRQRVRAGRFVGDFADDESVPDRFVPVIVPRSILE